MPGAPNVQVARNGANVRAYTTVDLRPGLLASGRHRWTRATEVPTGGEALSPTLAEKDVTLAFARHLRQELESRGITTLVLRDSDANLSLDDNAPSSPIPPPRRRLISLLARRVQRPRGVRIYTALASLRADATDEIAVPFRSGRPLRPPRFQ